MQLFVPLGVGREQAPRSSGSGLAETVAGTASPRLLVTGLHIIELARNLRNGRLGSEVIESAALDHLVVRLFDLDPPDCQLPQYRRTDWSFGCTG